MYLIGHFTVEITLSITSSGLQTHLWHFFDISYLSAGIYAHTHISAKSFNILVVADILVRLICIFNGSSGGTFTVIDFYLESISSNIVFQNDTDHHIQSNCK